MTKVFGAGVLAGAYKGGCEDRTLLTHAVSDEPVREGRLKREAGEAFCNRKLDLVDSMAWEPASAITCPKCKDGSITAVDFDVLVIRPPPPTPIFPGRN